MPRGNHKLEDAPAQTFVTTVDAQQRIRIPRDVGRSVSWLDLNSGSIECVASPSVRGVQFEPLASHLERQARFTRLIAQHGSPTVADVGENWVDVAGLLASTWRVQVSAEENRFSLTIPEPVRTAQLLPSAKGCVVVFGFGEILEVCEATAWFSRIRALKANPAAVYDALEALERS